MAINYGKGKNDLDYDLKYICRSPFCSNLAKLGAFSWLLNDAIMLLFVVCFI